MFTESLRCKCIKTYGVLPKSHELYCVSVLHSHECTFYMNANIQDVTNCAYWIFVTHDITKNLIFFLYAAVATPIAVKANMELYALY